MQNGSTVPNAVIALAGRRIDAPHADPPRFPSDSIALVRERIAQSLASERAVALVCSAACGADLLALKEAERLGIRRRIILPFAPERFRDTSVTDRPGDWGSLFDHLVEQARISGDLVVLHAGEGDEAYAAANKAIIREALALAEIDGPHQRLAVVVWEGAARSDNDATDGFRTLAVQAGFEVRTLLTQ